MTRIFDSNYFRLLIRGLFTVVFVGVVVFGLAILQPEYKQARALEGRRENLRVEIERKRSEIAEIKAMQKRFNTDREFVEDLARRNRRVYPGEIVFIFDN